MIKFLDIPKQDLKHLNNIKKNISKIINTSDFINGQEVTKFENTFAKFCSAKYCATVGNGTDALIIALKSLNLKKNDEVIIPAMTWKSTLLAPLNLNLKIRLVDIDKKSSNFNLPDLKKKITKKTKVIIGVHLYGNPIDFKEIKKLIGKKKIYLIEDAAQAHGAYDFNSKKKIGTLGDIACFSFYPGKNLGAYGDGGCLTTNNKKLFDKILMIKNIGSLNKFNCNVVGLNSRLDTIQASVLNYKIKDLKKNNLKRLKIANYYKKNIYNSNIEKINYKMGCVYHQYVIISKFKKKIIFNFKKNRIQFGEHYPISINKLDIIKKKFINQKFPNSENLAKFGISLPIDPNLKISEIKKICKVLNNIK